VISAASALRCPTSTVRGLAILFSDDEPGPLVLIVPTGNLELHENMELVCHPSVPTFGCNALQLLATVASATVQSRVQAAPVGRGHGGSAERSAESALLNNRWCYFTPSSSYSIWSSCARNSFSGVMDGRPIWEYI
jgi:hypothetical protein